MVEYTQNTSWNKLSQSWVPINKTSNTTLQMSHHMPHRCNFTLYFWRAPGEGYNNHWRTCAHRVQPACHSPLPCDPYSALIHWFIRWSPVLTPTFIFFKNFRIPDKGMRFNWRCNLSFQTLNRHQKKTWHWQGRDEKHILHVHPCIHNALHRYFLTLKKLQWGCNCAGRWLEDQRMEHLTSPCRV